MLKDKERYSSEPYKLLSQVFGIVDTQVQLLNFCGYESNILKASFIKVNIHFHYT
ncbi:hypothetical protein NIES4106_04930 [Fischerella sp. NIES-4106]|jgi:hypothetical protein|nr:hypothetical protein NIES4106_04930 [Fischerella sp. NIES-4106]